MRWLRNVRIQHLLLVCGNKNKYNFHPPVANIEEVLGAICSGGSRPSDKGGGGGGGGGAVIHTPR